MMVKQLRSKEGGHKEGIKVIIDESACNGCGICVEFCVRGVLAINDLGRLEVVRIDRCTECRICELLCPETAMMVAREECANT